MICKGYDFSHFFKGSIKEYISITESSAPHRLPCSRYLVPKKSETQLHKPTHTPQKGSQHHSTGEQGLSKLQVIPQKDTLLSGNITLLLGQKVCPMRRVGSCSSCCKWGLFYPNPSTKEGPQKDEGKDHSNNHRDSLQLGWNHMCRLPSSKQINTNLLSALPQAGSHGQEDWAWLNPAT